MPDPFRGAPLTGEARSATPLIAAALALLLLVSAAGFHLWKQFYAPNSDDKAIAYAEKLLAAVADGDHERALEAMGDSTDLESGSLDFIEHSAGLWEVERVGVVRSSETDTQDGTSYSGSVMARVKGESGVGFAIGFDVSSDPESGEWTVSELLQPVPVSVEAAQAVEVNGVRLSEFVTDSDTTLVVFPGEFTVEDVRFPVAAEPHGQEVLIGDRDSATENPGETSAFNVDWSTDDMDLSKAALDAVDAVVRDLVDSCEEKMSGKTEEDPTCPFSIELGSGTEFGEHDLFGWPDPEWEVARYPEVRTEVVGENVLLSNADPGEVRFSFGTDKAHKPSPPSGERWKFLCTMDFSKYTIPLSALEGDDLRLSEDDLVERGSVSGTTVCRPEES
ncbi:hypothetical protein [Salininema proteolyticum]|uniref:DUF4878 domain-containing protein n=2 Tax=Salininema proteolyticum TaxID=1607685 RepID=A0ABV8TYD6_9ACTN